MPLNRILHNLEEFSFFGGIPPKQLAGVADLFEEAAYPAGARIIEQDSLGDRLYIIISGEVEIRVWRSASGEENEESTLIALGRGEHFGEMELLDTQRRSASAVAVQATETLELTNMGLYAVFQRDPDAFRLIVMNIARELSRKLRAANRELSMVRVSREPS